MKPITLLIPTYNRSRALEAVWPSYINNPLVEEIIIVNDGSTDDSLQTIKRLITNSKTPVQLINHPERRGQQASRMSALTAAESDWVLFGEDDVWLESDYCAILLKEAINLGADIIAGRLVPLHVPSEFSTELICDVEVEQNNRHQVFDMHNLSANFNVRVSEPIVAPHLHSIALIRRNIFSRIQFDTYYAGNGSGEETDFYLSATKIGAKLYFTSSTVCYHLRGPICASGGQRVNRLAFEYFFFKNAAYLVSKHWPLLRRKYGFRGIPMVWVVAFMIRREWSQLKRVLRGDYKSSLKGG